MNCLTEPPEQSNRSVLSDCLKKVPSSASLCYIKILNSLTLQSFFISVQKSCHGLLLGEEKWNLPKGQKSRGSSKAKESSKLIENHNAESKSLNIVDL